MTKLCEGVCLSGRAECIGASKREFSAENYPCPTGRCPREEFRTMITEVLKPSVKAEATGRRRVDIANVRLHGKRTVRFAIPRHAAEAMRKLKVSIEFCARPINRPIRIHRRIVATRSKTTREPTLALAPTRLLIEHYFACGRITGLYKYILWILRHRYLQCLPECLLPRRPCA